MDTPSTSHDAASSASSSDASNNKIFEKWRKTFGFITGYGITPEERDQAVFDIHRGRCEKYKKELMNYSPSVVFMLKHLKIAGLNVGPEHLPCVPCGQSRAGGFSATHGIVVLCQGNNVTKRHMEQTIVHELIHMYDHAKFDVDWNNLRHHACSEIRANSLSGDCSLRREFDRLNFGFSKQHQTCVRRRAVISVMANEACPDQQSAERAVNEVWESCFNDTRPFDEIY